MPNATAQRERSHNPRSWERSSQQTRVICIYLPPPLINQKVCITHHSPDPEVQQCPNPHITQIYIYTNLHIQQSRCVHMWRDYIPSRHPSVQGAGGAGLLTDPLWIFYHSLRILFFLSGYFTGYYGSRSVLYLYPAVIDPARYFPGHLRSKFYPSASHGPGGDLTASS